METNIESSGSIGSNPVNVESKVCTEIDWEERRWELIKAAFQGFLVHKGAMSDNLLVDRVFELADAVFEKYRKENEK